VKSLPDLERKVDPKSASMQLCAQNYNGCCVTRKSWSSGSRTHWTSSRYVGMYPSFMRKGSWRKGGGRHMPSLSIISAYINSAFQPLLLSSHCILQRVNLAHNLTRADQLRTRCIMLTSWESTTNKRFSFLRCTGPPALSLYTKPCAAREAPAEHHSSARVTNHYSGLAGSG
jgi:hypothetical protein